MRQHTGSYITVSKPSLEEAGNIPLPDVEISSGAVVTLVDFITQVNLQTIRHGRPPSAYGVIRIFWNQVSIGKCREGYQRKGEFLKHFWEE